MLFSDALTVTLVLINSTLNIVLHTFAHNLAPEVEILNWHNFESICD